MERLADDDRLGARAADPALDRAVRVDDAVSARPRRRRAGDRDDRRKRKRPACRRELGCPAEEISAGRLLPVQAVTPASRRIFQTF
jgi:hypothetical protein